MAQSLSKVYIHQVFSTKYRQHILSPVIQPKLFNYLSGIYNNLECYPVKIGGFTDHVHILSILSKKITIIKLLEEVKKNSSKWIKTMGAEFINFHWQDGYGAFSVNPAEISVVSDYIERQEEHHRKVNFQDELRAFLKKYAVEYDERYVWD
ncbi:MAG: transposase [Bacteroidetes bacterium RIFCSPLOWO2_02_FULL_36_8]|nr:MAG: transposase [Bacteroidetes bacterium RIFCSPLOWO2_02_FULL_36_8]OFY70893.1 MAG: transposase [Bacteroidetes bacterium RIFCSPLOWO2_12_FULL_37_12]